MKLRHLYTTIIFAFSLYLFLSPVSANSSSTSSICQQLFNGADPKNYSQDVVDMCLITGYLQTPDNKPSYVSYENESQTAPVDSNEIIDSMIPDKATCSLTSPCPPGKIKLKNGQTKTVKGTCHISEGQDKGTCSYTNEVSLEHPIRGLDFADPLVTNNISNPNILLGKQLKRLLSWKDKLKLSLDLLYKKVPKSSNQVNLYLGAIDPQTEFSCFQTSEDPDGLTYTLKQLKDLIPDQIINLYQQNNWSELNNLYQQALSEKQLWAQLLACLPLAPSPPSSSQNPGFSYMRLKVGFKSTSFSLPPKTSSYPTDPQAGIYFGAFTWLTNSLSTTELKRLKEQLQQTNPLALEFFPDKPLTKKQTFFKTHPPLNPAYTLNEYGNIVTNNSHLDKTKISPPKKIASNNIEKANAVETTGFPTNLSAIIARVLAVSDINLEKHFITIPSLNQQVVDNLLKTQLQLELPANQQQLIDNEKNHPIALKGSTYGGGLEYIHLYQSRNFSVIMPYSFQEYCPPNAHIDEYVSGKCNPTPPSLSNPFLSP